MGRERSGGAGEGAESDGDGGVKTDGIKESANEERRSEGREMGQSAEERICGLKRNAPAMPHKYKKEERKGGGRREREEGTQRKPGYKEQMGKKRRTENSRAAAAHLQTF